MAIELTNPITQPSVTYTGLWVTISRVISNPNGGTVADYAVRPYGVVDGSIVMAPVEPTKRVINDVFAVATYRAGQSKPLLAQWLQLGQDLIAELEAEAASGGDPFNVPPGEGE